MLPATRRRGGSPGANAANFRLEDPALTARTVAMRHGTQGGGTRAPAAPQRGTARRLRAGRAEAEQLADALGGLEPRTGEHEHGGLVALDDAGGEEPGEPGG